MNHKNINSLAVTILLTVCLLVIQASLLGSPLESALESITHRDQEKLGPTRRAGLQQDRTQIPDMVALLHRAPAPDRFLMDTTLHSLAQMGAVDALPSMNDLIQSSADINVSNYAKAARSRLLAESEAGSEPDNDIQAQAKLERFYKELGETPDDINAGVTTYLKNLKVRVGPGVAPKFPAELYAMRELADMAYHSQYRGFTRLAGMSQIQFILDGRSDLKVRLAPLLQADQIIWLVQDLSKKQSMTDEESAEIQLASDLGPAAGQAAAAKLLEMDQHRDKYSRAGFSALFSVITMASGDDHSILDHFKNDPNPLIAEYARRGGGGQFIEAY